MDNIEQPDELSIVRIEEIIASLRQAATQCVGIPSSDLLEAVDIIELRMGTPKPVMIANTVSQMPTYKRVKDSPAYKVGFEDGLRKQESVDPEIDKEIAELLVGVLTHGFNSGTFRTESILTAIRENYVINIWRRG